MLKNIFIAIGLLVAAFFTGLFAGRTSGHNDNRIDNDTERERELAKRLHGIDADISEQLDSTQASIDGAAAKDKAVRDRKRTAGKIIADVKKRNGIK